MMTLCKIDEIENQFAKYCFEVMCKISKNMQMVLNEDDGKICEANYMITFAYLLGTQIRDENLLVGGELKKGIQLPQNPVVHELRERIRKIKKQSDCTIAKPDLVIHNSLSRKDYCSGQKIVIEAKTTSSLSKDGFCWDLFKLDAFIDQLDFDRAIYLIVNEKEKDVQLRLDEYEELQMPTISSNTRGKLLFFIQEDEKSEPLVRIISESDQSDDDHRKL